MHVAIGCLRVGAGFEWLLWRGEQVNDSYDASLDAKHALNYGEGAYDFKGVPESLTIDDVVYTADAKHVDFDASDDSVVLIGLAKDEEATSALVAEKEAAAKAAAEKEAAEKAAAEQAAAEQAEREAAERAAAEQAAAEKAAAE